MKEKKKDFTLLHVDELHEYDCSFPNQFFYCEKTSLL